MLGFVVGSFILKPNFSIRHSLLCKATACQDLKPWTGHSYNSPSNSDCCNSFGVVDGPGVGSCIGISSSSILVKLSTEIGKTGEVSFLFFFCHFNFDNRWFLCYNFLSLATCKKI